MMNLFLVVTSNQFQKIKQKKIFQLNYLHKKVDEVKPSSNWEELLLYIENLNKKCLTKLMKLCNCNVNHIQVNKNKSAF